MDQRADSAARASARGELGRRGIRLGRIAGVLVTMDWSLLIVFALITFALSVGPLPAWHPDWGGLMVFATAVSAAVLFIASILAHELSHAIVGRRLGIDVRHITLFVFGGMAHMENEPRSWGAELAMAIAGPVTSILLGILFFYLAGVAAGPGAMDTQDPMAALAKMGPVATVFIWLGPVNILVGLFNMVPGFPLDGGRVLRALLWGATGNLVKATQWAAAAGQGFAWLLIGSGFAMIFGIRVPIFGEGPVAGLWIALIGWFLNNAATMGYRRVKAQETLGDLAATDVMHRDFEAVRPDSTVRAFVDQHLLGTSQRAFPVIENDRLQGLVCLADVRRLERERYEATRVAEIMTPIQHLLTLSPEDTAGDAMNRLAERQVNQLPVVADDRLLGMVTREDIMRCLSFRRGR